MSKQLDELKKIVGSLLVIGFEGPRLTASCKNFLQQWDLGGVILFKRNIESLEQVASLNHLIDETAVVPPIISVDHEGGRVFRLPEPFTVFPPMGRVAAQCQAAEGEAVLQDLGRAFGRELRAAGFNLDYAPILDVNSNPANPIIGDRAFGTDPADTAAAALNFLTGLQSTGVLGCGKHFPGHGDTFEDSHKTLPVVEKSRGDLALCELIPFREAVACQVPMLMTAHVMYPALDKEWPATLSKKILTDLLRHKMAFEGVIASDDLFMEGIAAQWSLEEAAERFLRAGGDMILLCHQEAVQRRVAAALVHVAERDSEFREMLEQKRRRVDALRARLVGGAQPELLAQYEEKHRSLAERLG